MTNVVVNGNAYSDDGSSSRDMRQGGFRQWLLPMIDDQMIEVRGSTSQVAAAVDAAQAAQAGAEAASSDAQTARGQAEAARDDAQQASTDAQAHALQAGRSATEAGDAKAAAEQAAADAIAVGPGWTPIIAIVRDGERLVWRVVDFAGGTGGKPVELIGKYIGLTGYVSDIADATDVRGQADSGVVVRPTPAAGIVSAPAGERSGDTVVLQGYGLYVWDADSTTPADRETVIEGTDVAGPGRWLLQLPSWEFVWESIWAGIGPLLDDRNALIDAAAQQLDAMRSSLQAAVDLVTPLRATATLDFASIAAGRTAYLTAPVPGAAPGMAVALGAPAALPAGLTATAHIASAGNVTVGLTNTTDAAVDPAAMSYSITVFKG